MVGVRHWAQLGTQHRKGGIYNQVAGYGPGDDKLLEGNVSGDSGQVRFWQKAGRGDETPPEGWGRVITYGGRGFWLNGLSNFLASIGQCRDEYRRPKVEA